MGFLEQLRRIDNFWIGVLLGIALPALLYPVLRPLDPANFSFIQTFDKLTMIKLLPMLLSRCVFPNALLFFIFIWTDFNLAAKGVLYTTVVLTGILIIIQFIF
jgi:hypothetical protein